MLFIVVRQRAPKIPVYFKALYLSQFLEHKCKEHGNKVHLLNTEVAEMLSVFAHYANHF